MNGLRRWLEAGSGATELEREILRVGVNDEPPADAKGEVWTALMAGVAAAGAVAAASSTATSVAATSVAATSVAATSAAAANVAATSVATTSSVATSVAAVGNVVASAAPAAALVSAPAVVAGGGGLLASALIGAGSAVFVLTTYAVVVPTTPTPSASSHVSSVEAPSRPALPLPPPARRERGMPAPEAPASSEAAEAASSETAEPAASALPSRAVAGKPAQTALDPARRHGNLVEESRAVGEARALLRQGDAPGALRLLERIAIEFGGGGLGQEREALTIEALARSGSASQAAARANAFLEAYPSSPLVDRVRPFARLGP